MEQDAGKVIHHARGNIVLPDDVIMETTKRLKEWVPPALQHGTSVEMIPGVFNLILCGDDWVPSTVVRLNVEEFSSLCPLTGLVDYGKLLVEYIPDRYFIEAGSFRKYLDQFRNSGVFNETLVQCICRDILKLTACHRVSVVGTFTSCEGLGMECAATLPDDEAFD